MSQFTERGMKAKTPQELFAMRVDASVAVFDLWASLVAMLSKLEKRGVVTHRTEGRQFVYRPLVSEAEVARSMVLDLTKRVFDGDASALVSHLLSEHEIDADELGRLKTLLGERAGEEEVP